MYLERYILPVSNTLSRSFSVPLFSQFLSQIEIVAMGMRIHGLVSYPIFSLDSSRSAALLSLRSQRDTMDFNPSRTAVRVIVSLRPPVSFLPIGTREERGGEGEGKRNSRVEKSWRGRSVDAQGNAIICNPA